MTCCCEWEATVENSDVTRDAIVVLPGIMGSELRAAETGRVLWGISDPLWYVSAWTTGQGLRDLAVTEAERQGETGRVVATRLLAAPAFAPMLRGLEPYSAMLRAAEKMVPDPAAILKFAYDWRLPVEHAARELATAAERHLDQWRRHPQGSRDAKLILVAHSMGGLVACHFVGLLGGDAIVRRIITLGAPFFGSTVSVEMLAEGRGGPLPLPRGRLRRLARTLPGLYDLLPHYACVAERDGPRRLTSADVAGIGGDRAQAERALGSSHDVVRAMRSTAVELHCLIGVGQPTPQSVTLTDGTLGVLQHTVDHDAGRTDRRGDSTVYRDAAAVPGRPVSYLPQSHSALAATSESTAFVRAVVTQRPLGPPLGPQAETAATGVEVPDVVTVGEPFRITVDQQDPAAVSAVLWSLETRQVETAIRLDVDGDVLSAHPVLQRPGLYRIEVDANSYSPVKQLLMATGPGKEGPRD
jgi:lecithin:cholesterol acyltransferase